MALHTQKSHHIAKIDALRGLAVLGMIVAHALFFFHNHTLGLFTAAEQLLNTAVLTGFVFISGLSLSRWMDRHSHLSTRALLPQILRRAGILYLVYAVTAAVAVATVVPAPSRMEFALRAWRALVLLDTPNFTEYLPLFILLVIFIFPLRKLFRWTRQSLLLTVIAGALSYGIGVVFYPFALGPYADEIKQLFAGGDGSLRFPLLFYFPVFLLGLWWQYQTDHVHHARKLRVLQNSVLGAAIVFAVLSIIAARHYVIPLADPSVRWPPSLAFLAIGLTVSAVTYITLPSFRWMGAAVRSIIVYIGRDSIDLWMNHLIVLFLFRKFIGAQSDDAALILLQTTVVILVAIAASSVQLTNRIVFPLQMTLAGSTRFRKRYALIILATISMLLFTADQARTASTASGSGMVSTPFTVLLKLPKDARLQIAADRQWVTPGISRYGVITVTLRAVNGAGTPISVSPQQVTLHIGTMIRTIDADKHTDGSLIFTLPVNDIPVGTYALQAALPSQEGTAQSNTISLSVTAPLFVAWTFDWEGWDVADSVFRDIDGLETPYRKIPFTHFVSARTFLPGALPAARQKAIAAYLQKRSTAGDEIALHLHMFFDLVSASGVTTRTTSAWGLGSDIGYDIPATEYSPAEFGTLLEFSKSLLKDAGLPVPRGYRSGGWFLNTQLLDELETHGFSYDSSGRDRPGSGAFAAILWDLPVGAQPYYPGAIDQNDAATGTTGILEIPNNGVTTYESGPDALIRRAKTVYSKGVLTQPKVLVYTSHPQFAGREFASIPAVLSYFDTMSLALDRGPVVYATVSDIYTLWASSE